MSEIKKSDSCCAGDGTHYENHAASLPAQTRPPAPAEKVKTRGIKCGDCGTPVSIKAFCPTCDSARAVTPNAVVEFIKQAQYICEKGEPRTCDIDLLRKLGKAAYPSGYEKLAGAPAAGSAERWIPVSEKLPDQEQPVLVYAPNYGCNDNMVVNERNGAEWRLEQDCGSDGTVTHWQPLPEPPALAGTHTDVAKEERDAV